MNLAEKALLFIAIAWVVWTLACAVKAGPKPRWYSHLSSERFGTPPGGQR